MALKPEDLADMRSRLLIGMEKSPQFRARGTSSDTEPVHVSNNSRQKEKHIGTRTGVPIWIVSISVPWGGTRRYASNARGMGHAIKRAVERDGRLSAMETQELALIGIRAATEGIKPPLQRGEVRLLLNTER